MYDHYDNPDIRDAVYDILDQGQGFFVGQGDVQSICTVLDKSYGYSVDERTAILVGAYLARWSGSDLDTETAIWAAEATLDMIKNYERN